MPGWEAASADALRGGPWAAVKEAAHWGWAREGRADGVRSQHLARRLRGALPAAPIRRARRPGTRGAAPPACWGRWCAVWSPVSLSQVNGRRTHKQSLSSPTPYGQSSCRAAAEKCCLLVSSRSTCSSILRVIQQCIPTDLHNPWSQSKYLISVLLAVQRRIRQTLFRSRSWRQVASLQHTHQ